MKKFISALLLLSVLLTIALPVTVSAKDDGYHWVGSWSTSPVDTGVNLGSTRFRDFLMNACYRTVIQMTLGGEQVRLRFSNRFGTSPVTIDQTFIARTSPLGEADILKGSSIPVTFGGKTAGVIPAGGELLSDPVKMKVSALEYLSITSYVEKYTQITTAGFYGGTTYMETGKRCEEESFTTMGALLFTAGAITYHVTPFICGADVWAPADAYSVVFAGDSTITNQAPYYLAEKLAKSGVKNVGVLQQAIVANKLLNDGYGASLVGNIYGSSLLNRFDADVLAMQGVKKVFVKIGVNDIIHPRCKSMQGKVPLVTVEELLDGYSELVERAHKAGIEIYFFSRTAWKGYDRNFGLTASDEPDIVWTQEAEDMMLTINKWLWQFSGADGYIDLDFLRDPADQTKLRDEYTLDGAHFTDLGARLLVDAIPDRYIVKPPKTLISVNELYENGKGGEKVTTPYKPSKTKEDKPAEPTKGNSDSGNKATEAQKTEPATQKHEDIPAATVPTTQRGTDIPRATTVVYVTQKNEGEVQTIIVTVPTEPTTELIKPEPEKTLSAGAKAGIAIVAVLLISTASLLTVYFTGKKRLED